MVDADLPWFFHPQSFLSGQRLLLTGGESDHAGRSLRLKSGDHLMVTDGRGTVGEGVVEGSRSGGIDVRIGACRMVPRPVETEIRLAAAVLRGPRYEILLEKATELGVSGVIPLITRHTEIRPHGDEKPERWRRLMVAALKQSRQAWLPEIEPIRSLEDILTGERPRQLWVAHPGAPADAPVIQVGNPLLLLVGPEGGLHPQEVALLRARGASFISLGPNRLRAETAGLALVVYGLSRLGLLGSHPGGFEGP